MRFVHLLVGLMVLATLGLWSFGSLLIWLVACFLARWLCSKGPPSEQRFIRQDDERRNDVLFAMIAAIPVLIFAALTLSGAVTNPDFLMFWGVKGERFAIVHGVDVAFLREPHHLFMHSDYPPLVPAIYALTMIGSRSLHWFGALALAPLLLAATTVVVARSLRDGALTALFAAIFAFLFIDNSIAGNAEPFLILFETIALAALLFDDEPLVAATALTAAVLTKVEGVVFVAATVGALVVFRRLPLRRAIGVAIPSMTAIILWITYCARNGLLDAYAPHHALVNWNIAKPLLAESAMGSMYLPWIAVVLLIACGRARMALPAVIAAGAFIVFLIVVWIGTEAQSEIAWSAKRVLMTPLLLLFFGAAKALSARAECRTAP